MSEIRKLSTIVFADIAGYTATMQENEQKALLYLNGFKSILYQETEKFKGEIIQFFGDGCLLSFDSSTNAVYCSIELQKRFLEEGDIPVRIGIHLGEVVFKEGNAFGDGVNIASRVESMGIPGAILMSKIIRDQLKNKGDILLVSLGSFNFKNVAEPLEVFAVANPGFVVPKRNEMKGKLEEKTSNFSKKTIIVLALFLIVIVTTLFFIFNKNGFEERVYEVKANYINENEVDKSISLVKMNFNNNKVSGVYINNIGERGIITGTKNGSNLQLTFNSSFFAGECEFIGLLENNNTVFKGKYSCSFNEYASIRGVENKKPSFKYYSKQDSIYFMNN